MRIEHYLMLSLVGIILIGLTSIFAPIFGFGIPRSQSQYTGHVVDVVEDKGVIFKPSWVNMKTDPRSSDIQQYCIRNDKMLSKFYKAMENGKRVTVTYSRPFWVSPNQCGINQAILSDVKFIKEEQK